MEKVTRVIRLLAIIAVSAGSLLLAACGGKDKITPESGNEPSGTSKECSVPDVSAPDSAHAVPPAHPRVNPAPAAVDAGTDSPDSGLWKVICE